MWGRFGAMEVKNTIKAILAEKNIQIQELAKGVDASPVTVSRWVNNKQQPSLSTLYEIAKFLDVDICSLLSRNHKTWIVPLSERYSERSRRYNPQSEHERLVQVLNDHYFGEDRIAIMPDAISYGNLEDLDVNMINASVSLVVTLNNLTGGAIADMDLYSLLRRYLHDPEKRKAINNLL